MSDITIGLIIMSILGAFFCTFLVWFVFKLSRPFSKGKL